MKKLMMVAMSLIMVASVSFAETSTQKEIRKERQEIRKLAKKELNARVGKTVKKGGINYIQCRLWSKKQRL